MTDASTNDTATGIARRALLGGAIGAVTLSQSGPLAAVVGGRVNLLRDQAARRGREFGCMLSAGKIMAGGPYLDLVATQASMIVPGNELKWTATERTQGQKDYRAADSVVQFAKSRKLRVRGHTGFWFRGIPAWAAPVIKSSRGPAVAIARIQDVVARYRGQLFEWDVVNEIIDPRDGQVDGLRLAPFDRHPGIGFIADCFRAAHNADPSAKLFYNEYGIEYDGPVEDARRSAVLSLLTKLVAQGVPIHGLGIQSHLSLDGRFSAAKFLAFMTSVAALGLRIRLTEFDINDSAIAADIATRDRLSADAAYGYLSTAFQQPAVLGLLTWGLADSDSWLIKNPNSQRDDGMPVRALPFDENLRPKPMWSGMARAFNGAPMRARRQGKNPGGHLPNEQNVK